MTKKINIVIDVDRKKASGELSEFKGDVDGLSGSTGKLGASMAGLGAVAGAALLAIGAAGVAAATAGAAIGFGFNSSVEQAQTKLMAFMKDGNKVAQTLSWVKDEAAKTQFSFTDMADAAANLTPVAKTSGKSLESLVQQAEILAAINPAEGLTGATFSLREALSGDWVSIVDRFNLPRQRINELKEQGVPAMEIISRTLSEMGIDYGLVAAQGQTLSARFDQVKDKLTMMAGAATKPIFDKVSKEFDKLGQVDFTKIGNDMADTVQNVLGSMELLSTGDFNRGMFADTIQEDSKLVDVLLTIRDTAIGVINFLKPAFTDFANTFTNNLIPAFRRLWVEAGPILKTLAIALGATLVAALYGLAEVLSFSADAWSNTFNMITGSIRFVEDVIGNSVSFIIAAWSSMIAFFGSVNAFFAGIPGFFSNVWSSVVTGVQSAVAAIGAWFAQLPQMIAFGLGFVAGLLVGFVTQTIPSFVNSTIQWFQQLPGAVGGAISAMYGAVVQWFSNTGSTMTNTASSAVNGVSSWFSQLPGRVGSAVSSMWSGAVSAANGFKDSFVSWANGVVNAVVDVFTGLPGRISAAIRGAVDTAKRWLGDIGSNVMEGFKAGVGVSNRHALGTAYSPGGSTLVGEHGPEIVNMPRGAQVTQAYRTQSILSQNAGGGDGGVVVNITGPISFNNRSDIDYFAERISATQRLALKGMA
ncbi:hypothetical protein QM806_04335 [Rhodococcus sp. IEGM 1351]|uniref:phage tail protein n=1 Tax=Rhodococcus sp. IEGM 1351 TaxID=3047089 RepID=UPI0024B6CFB6|nr:hypothetical protein [Rhodococcus sp. IEGM 1351]MDI9934682.1 hypothetical protein [Rhodococcus sp. IEGM 1351]